MYTHQNERIDRDDNIKSKKQKSNHKKKKQPRDLPPPQDGNKNKSQNGSSVEAGQQAIHQHDIELWDGQHREKLELIDTLICFTI